MMRKGVRADVRRAILTVHDNICFYCPAAAVDADHIVAPKHGGTDHPRWLAYLWIIHDLGEAKASLSIARSKHAGLGWEWKIMEVRDVTG